MAEASVARRGIVVPDAPAVNMARGLKGYGPMEEQPVRKVEVVEDETLKRMKAAFSELLAHKPVCAEDYYGLACERTRRLQCTPENVEQFSIVLAALPGRNGLGTRAGLILSAIMNNGDAQRYVIRPNSLLLSELGYRNMKNIIVEGDVGDSLGWKMEAGSITVNGNVGDLCGGKMKRGTITVNGNAGNNVGNFMEGGSIAVRGNAGNCVGDGMKGGMITVEGNAGDYIGEEMEGGTIMVEGNTGKSVGGSSSLAMTGGKIYHKGKLVMAR